MPILGQGILPVGASGGNELQAVTRRAFVPKVIVQLYKATATLSALLAQAETVTGGVSPVTVPIQGTAMVTTQRTDYSGSFTGPQVQTGLQNAEFNLRAYVTPIPFYVMEGLVQIDASVIPILEARMNDSGNSIADALATDFWTANTSFPALSIWSFPEIADTANPAAARGNFGGVDKSTSTFWQGNKKTITSITGTTTWTRSNVLAAIASSTKSGSGEMPTFGVCGLGAWAALAQDFIGLERYVITPEASFAGNDAEARAVFTALSVGGVPIYADLYKTPTTELALMNMSYLGFKIHQDAAFAVAGPESLLPNFQLGYIMVLVTLLEVVCSKPATQSLITGWTGDLTL